ncbi:MAG: hypothetical protein UT33_C0010G0034 [Candidatus Peregrinibacteria bacterium GW2011_GWC2_39_14]|nr:MAG: hypothetical protein US92_C0006G0034 [Candidatus Peregrinibacteria bacterium GW2011_GWA2_38_36]KKR05891.1 MAG: hypothetical protein UT33_C0010G0034 [Candidatus Peregrinibacteria bacterium GW2011_GWC2_39_14]
MDTYGGTYKIVVVPERGAIEGKPGSSEVLFAADAEAVRSVITGMTSRTARVIDLVILKWAGDDKMAYEPLDRTNLMVVAAKKKLGLSS